VARIGAALHCQDDRIESSPDGTFDSEVGEPAGLLVNVSQASSVETEELGRIELPVGAAIAICSSAAISGTPVSSCP